MNPPCHKNYTRFKSLIMAPGRHVPIGFAPFNIQNIGNNLFVAYAQQDSAKTFVNFGAGLGFVDVFTPERQFLMQLQSGDWLMRLGGWFLLRATSEHSATRL